MTYFTLKFQQLNDSTVIISILETYLGDRSQSLEKIKTYYPSLESKDPKGKKTTEYPNKYFVMYGENILDKRTLEQKK